MRIALMVLAVAAAARAQSLNALGITRLNQDAQSLWAHDGISLAQQAALSELQKLVNVPHAIDSSTTATMIAVNGLTLDTPMAPGVKRLDGSGVEIALPLSGAWNITASVRMHVKGQVIFIPIDDTFNVTIALTGLTASMSAAFDSSDPSAPRVTVINPPVAHFNVSVTSSNDLVNALGWLSGTLVNNLGQKVIGAAAVFAAAKLNVMVQGTPSVMNAGGPGAAPIARANLEDAAAKLGDQIETYRTPFGPILEMQFDKSYTGTWADSLNDPHFDPGHGIAPYAYGDSGEMTGHYLAALAYQYATTHDPRALLRAKRAIAVETTLLTMRGEPGNMNRSIMPISFLPQWMRPGPTYVPGNDYALQWNNDQYYFSDYMSRDEYMGLFYGLSIARDLINDASVKASAQAGMEMALDYLLRNNWTWRRRDGGWGERWAGVVEEQYGWVLAAWSGNKAKYQAVHDQYRGFADLAWTGYWMAAVDPYDSYYKFQLGAGSIYVLLQHETDPAAWMRAYQSVSILRHYIGHHLNAHFNNVYLAFDAGSKARLGVENTNLLSRWLQWPRRRQRVSLHSDASIEKVMFTPPLMPGAQAIEIAKYPLPPDRRIGSGFMWSVSPCQLDPGYPAGPDATIEGETLDYVLPYWMSRYYGAIVPPRLPPPNPTGSPE